MRLSNGANANIPGGVYDNFPLHETTSSEAVKLLLRFGANIDATNKFNNTPLNETSRKGHLSAVQGLCDGGADVNHTGYWDRTPLHQATWYNHVSTVKYLLSQQPDVNIEMKDNRTALDIAREKGYTDIVDVMKDHNEGKTNIKGQF